MKNTKDELKMGLQLEDLLGFVRDESIRCGAYVAQYEGESDRIVVGYNPPNENAGPVAFNLMAFPIILHKCKKIGIVDEIEICIQPMLGLENNEPDFTKSRYKVSSVTAGILVARRIAAGINNFVHADENLRKEIDITKNNRRVNIPALVRAKNIAVPESTSKKGGKGGGKGGDFPVE